MSRNVKERGPFGEGEGFSYEFRLDKGCDIRCDGEHYEALRDQTNRIITPQ